MTATVTHPTAQAQTRTAPFDRRRFAILVGTGAIVNLLVFVIGQAAGAPMVVSTPDATRVIAPLFVVASVAPLTLAAVVTWFVVRRAPWSRRPAAWIGASVAALSAIAPFVMAPDASTAATLAVMHIVAGAVWLLALLTGRSTTRHPAHV